MPPNRARIWAARRYSALNGRVHDTALDHHRGLWRVTIRQRWHLWQIWYPELDKATLMRARAERLR